MSGLSAASSKPAAHRFQFSLGTLLLWIMVICLVISNAMTLREVSALKREMLVQDVSPLPAREVARQFQERTTRDPITVSVKDVRYSSKADSYRVDFSWTNATTGKTWSTDIELISNGYGAYQGVIRSDQFIAPLGIKNGFFIAVETPSPLGR